jgi:hypothetical protein
MAFTAGSPELAKAQKLGNILSECFIRFGSSRLAGITGAQLIENKARDLGFGITGLTTGGGFPPFGSAGITANRDASVFGTLTAVLQNPAGLTRPNGITVAPFGTGQTVGIYLKKFVRDGSDVTVTNSATGAVAGTTLGFGENNFVNRGFTATVYFSGSPTGTSAGITFSVN